MCHWVLCDPCGADSGVIAMVPSCMWLIHVWIGAVCLFVFRPIAQLDTFDPTLVDDTDDAADASGARRAARLHAKMMVRARVLTFCIYNLCCSVYDDSYIY